MTISNRLARPADRRAVLKAAAGFGAAAVAATALGGGVARAGLVQYRTTARLNLRAGAGTTYPVITVIPAGTILAHMGKVANGFYEVGYGHTYGWVHGAYLEPAGSTDPVMIGSATVLVNANLRSGPSLYDGVLRVVPSGATVQVSDTVRGGFRYVIHNGLAGWIYDSLLSHRDAPSETFTTTARLNLRAEPSTSAKVLLVMPSGATVTALPAGVSGWRKVSYKGTVGWAATAYLN
jgi:mannosyl-glycoprotein endo-beta-N-acetylglucosaminidase